MILNGLQRVIFFILKEKEIHKIHTGHTTIIEITVFVSEILHSSNTAVVNTLNHDSILFLVSMP